MKSLLKKLNFILFAGVLLFTLNVVSAQPGKIVKVKKVTVVSKLPAKCKVVKINKKRYYRHNGVYYVKVNRGYKVVSTPIGLKVSILPKGAKRLILNKGIFYVKNNTYYRYNRKSKSYFVVAKPV